MTSRFVSLLLPVSLVLSVSILSSCGGAQEARPLDEVADNGASCINNGPQWLRKGCTGMENDEGNKRICAMGSAGGSRNMNLMRTTAEGRARTEIARQLGLRVQSMLKDYQNTATGDDQYGVAAWDEQHITDVSKQITDITLSGTEMIESFVCDEDGTYYVLVELNVNGFKESISKMDKLSDHVRAAVEQRADKAFAELDEAIAQ